MISITTRDIIEIYGEPTPPEGQILLFKDEDDLAIARRTKFKPVDPKLDRHAIVHWWTNIFSPAAMADACRGRDRGADDFEVFKTWRDAAYDAFHFVTIGVAYNREADQQCFSVAPDRDRPVMEQIEELRLWLPHIKACENGIKRLSISCAKSSMENGVYELEIENDNAFRVYNLRYHTAHFQCAMSSVENVVRYLRLNLPRREWS